MNPDAARENLMALATEVTGSRKSNVFMVANSIFGQDCLPEYKKRVLEMLERAPKYGERSIKMRQALRENPKKNYFARPAVEALQYPVKVTKPSRTRSRVEDFENKVRRA